MSTKAIPSYKYSKEICTDENNLNEDDENDPTLKWDI